VMGFGKAVRENMDALRYKRSEQGKAEKKARKEHNEKFGPTDKKTKRVLKKAAKKSDAAKGRYMRERDDSSFKPEMSTRYGPTTIKMENGGVASLKEVPAGKKGKGLSQLPTEVRNKMGFMKDGGEVTPPKPLPKDSKNAKGRRLKRSPGNKNEAGGDPMKPIRMKDGGGVCRGGKSAMRGTQFRGVR